MTARAEKPGILFVHNGGDWLAGSERCLLSLMEGLRGRGFRCSVLCNNPVLVDACRPLGIPAGLYRSELFLLPIDRPQLNPLPVLRTVSAIHRFARRRGADLIHSNNVLPTQAAFWAAKRLGVPIVAHVRGGRYFRASRWASCIRWADAVLCVSEGVSAAYWPETLQARLHVVYDGIETAPFEAASGSAMRKALAPGRTLLVGTAAFLRPEKAIQDFVAVADRAKRDGVDCVFAVAGDGPEKAMLTDLARSRGLGDRVRFLGYIEQIPEFLKALDVFLLTSGADALPGALIQAGAAGIASVATAVGGVGEILADGVTGLLAPAGDVETLWAGVRRLLDDAPLRRRMGDAARERVLERFSMTTYVDRVAEVYESLL